MANSKSQWLAAQLTTFFKRFMPELDKRYASGDNFDELKYIPDGLDPWLQGDGVEQNYAPYISGANPQPFLWTIKYTPPTSGRLQFEDYRYRFFFKDGTSRVGTLVPRTNGMWLYNMDGYKSGWTLTFPNDRRYDVIDEYGVYFSTCRVGIPTDSATVKDELLMFAPYVAEAHSSFPNNGRAWVATIKNIYAYKALPKAATVDLSGYYTKTEADAAFLPADTVLPKANAGESITMDDDGTLHVGGRLGQHASGGIYAPVDISPNNVGPGSMLVTDGSGTSLGNKSLSVSTGGMLTINSMPAGATSFTMSGSYANRIYARMAMGGIVALNEATAKTNYATITSVKQGGNDINLSTDQTGNITFTLSKSLGNTSAVTQLRFYPSQTGFSNILGGVAKATGGYSLVAGQNVANESNGSTVTGNTNFNNANSSFLAGRQNINTKQNSALIGMGHKNLDGPTELCAVGKWSKISSTTAFAVGGGTSDTARKNLFEVDTTGNLYLLSPSGYRFKVSVSDTGSITATKV